MDDSRTVYVGNLPMKITEELLYELFLQVGPLERVKIPTDREGRQSNYAFVTFKHDVSVNYAVELLNNMRLYESYISVRPRNNKNTDKGNGNLSQRQNRGQENDNRGNRHSRGHEHLDTSHLPNLMQPQSFIGNVSYEDLINMGQMMQLQQSNYDSSWNERKWEDSRDHSFQDRDRREHREHRNHHRPGPGYNRRSNDGSNRHHNRNSNDWNNRGGKSRRNNFY